MADERFAEHLERPAGRGIEGAAAAHVGAAGGAPCGDLVTVGIVLEHGCVATARFEAAGCGALTAAASAAVTLVEHRDVLDAARVGAHAIADELGGLTAGKFHAADLVADALHRALGDAVRAAPPRELVADRTLVAMSGGVDSAVAALLCARGKPPPASRPAGEPPRVAAVTLELWRDPANDAESSCCSASAVRCARALAHRLGLPHFTLDLRAEFRAGVVEPYLVDHAAGLTPNPCVRCNGHVRLDGMLELGDRLGAATLATGHYARTRDGLLRLAADPAKDQTYMLAAVAPRTLGRLRFPLGELTKPQVRALAREHDLPVADKRDSQDLCFLAGTGRTAFLARHANLRERPGDIVDRAGRRLGRHRGHHQFTVGQRRGIGVAGPEPLYVLATDADANTVTVGPRDQLATQTVRVRDASVHAIPDAVKLRYATRAVPCRLKEDVLHLDEPFDGAAPGQTAVFLAGDAVVGCATIAAP
ncbi:MAG: tRNA 2-thiouridine(34) synthase MnmA [Solirubrobacteraceae bacterium MAG38_C4-C5]|nr:tRNA 2-thiouridine(34) synthase MnmA [Candidatus Siliceabacter maunaloa]